MGHSRQQLLSRIDRNEGSVEQAVYTLLNNMTDSEYETFVNRTVQDLVKQDILEKDSQHMAKGNAPINKTDSPMPEVGIIICDTCKDVGRVPLGIAGGFKYCSCKEGVQAERDDEAWENGHVRTSKKSAPAFDIPPASEYEKGMKNFCEEQWQARKLKIRTVLLQAIKDAQECKSKTFLFTSQPLSLFYVTGQDSDYAAELLTSKGYKVKRTCEVDYDLTVEAP